MVREGVLPLATREDVDPNAARDERRRWSDLTEISVSHKERSWAKLFGKGSTEEISLEEIEIQTEDGELVFP